MRQYKPVTKHLDIADADGTLATLVATVSQQSTRVLLEEHGEPVAAIISIDDWRRFAELEKDAEDPWAIIDEIRAAFADVSDEEIEAEVDRAIAELRAEARTGARSA